MRRPTITSRLRAALLMVVVGAAHTQAGEPALGEPPWRLGLAWEAPLEAAVRAQRLREARGVGPDALVEQAARRVRREASVADLYALARAYGLRAQRDDRHDAARCDDRASARATYAEVLELEPRCYPAHHDLGVLALQASPGATEQAFAHFHAAYAVNPDYAPTLRQLTRLHHAAGEPGRALPLLRRILAVEPQDHEARARLAVSLAELGRHAEADAAFEVLLRAGREPTRWLLLRAQTELHTGRPEQSLRTWKKLARANPYQRVPLLGMLKSLMALQEVGRDGSDTDYLFALRGLRRVERDAAVRIRLLEDIRRVEHRMAAPAVPPTGAAPDAAQVLHALDAPDEGPRRRALLALLVRPELADETMLRAVAQRTVPTTEPSSRVRAGAVRVLGRMGGTRLVPLLRHALDDEDARVRIEAVDTLRAIAGRDAEAQAAVVTILGLHVQSSTATVAAAAQQAVLGISRVRLTGIDAESDAATWSEAFARWWRSPQGLDVQVRALEGYHRSGDLASDQVLTPYLASDAFLVFCAAYRALRRTPVPAGTGVWVRWWRALPSFGAARLKNEHWPSLRVEMEAWVRSRPRG